jgi:hypothetical protein
MDLSKPRALVPIARLLMVGRVEVKPNSHVPSLNEARQLVVGNGDAKPDD